MEQPRLEPDPHRLRQCPEQRTSRRTSTPSDAIMYKLPCLDGLHHHLMDPDLTEVFCKEYTEHMQRGFENAHVASKAACMPSLRKIEREFRSSDLGNLRRRARPQGQRPRKHVGIVEAKIATPTHHRRSCTRTWRAITDSRSVSYVTRWTIPHNCTEFADILRTLIDRIELKPVTIDARRRWRSTCMAI